MRSCSGIVAKALDALGIDDGQIESGLGAVVEENGIDHFARAWRQTERNVGNAQHGAHVRDFLLDDANAFDGFHRAANVVFIAGSARENQRIENDIFGVDAVLAGEQLVGALGNFELALASEGLRLHGIFVDAADD